MCKNYNVQKLPSKVAIERLAAAGLTQYTYEEIFEVAKLADSVNLQWESVVRRAVLSATDELNILAMTPEQGERYSQVMGLSNKYNKDVIIFAARHRTAESFKISTARREINSKQNGINKLENLIKKFS